MHRLATALAVVVLAVTPAMASGPKEPMDAVKAFIEGFNKGDVAATVAACTDEASIIDEFPPHEWHGAGACQTWWNDYAADAKQNEITDGVVKLGRAHYIAVNGNHAYVVVPADYTYKKHGRVVREVASTLTVVLTRNGDDWRIAAWSWSKN